MSISKCINEIRKKLEEGDFINEALISQGLLLPILQNLGWPVFDTKIVIPEYQLEGRSVFALCNNKEHPQIFIEVKKIGQVVGADKQLFEYTFHKGIPFAILTDGREWHFYLPAEEGEYQERRVYKLDIIERNIDDTVEHLNRYLSFERVISGKALESARKDYKNISRKRKMNNTFPIAWKRLLEEDDEMLLELLADKVEDLCGFKPELSMCSSYLTEIVKLSHTQVVNHKISQKNRIVSPDSQSKNTKNFTHNDEKVATGTFNLIQLANKNLGNVKPVHMELNNITIETKSWSNLCEKLIDWLIKNKHLKKAHLPIYNAAAKNKYFVNSKPEHENPAKNGFWKNVKGFYIDVKYATKVHIQNIIHILKHLGIEDIDLKIKII